MINLNDIFLEIDQEEKQLFDLLLGIARISSPTGQETKKIHHIQKIIQKLEFTNTRIDNEGNCIVMIPNNSHSAKPRKILFVAHADTACCIDSKEVPIKQNSQYIYGHGVCDNSAGIVGLLTFLKLVNKHKIHFPNDIIVGFTVGEEGLGGKRGMKEVVKKYGKSISAVVNVESHNIGRLTHKSVGQYRTLLSIETKEGGHSFRDFGRPNAIVILTNIIRDFSKKKLPQKKGKTTFNIGKISGGDGVNVIAKLSSALLEIRSEDKHYFDNTKNALHNIIKRYQATYPDVKIKSEVYADSAPGSIPPAHPLCLLVEEAQKSLNIAPHYDSGNTDGDVSLAEGIPTVTIGTSIGWNTHSLSEYMEKKSFCLGLKQAFIVLYNVALLL